MLEFARTTTLTAFIALLVAASVSLGYGGLALADAPPTAPAASPTPALSYADAHVIKPLREIGRVKATSAFCKNFVMHSRPAVDSAIVFEAQLLQTVADLRNANLSDPLTKHRAADRLEHDLVVLTDLTNAGRTELSTIGDAVPGDKRLIAFRDALDAAKGRQKFVASQVAAVVARFEETPSDQFDEGTYDIDTWTNGPFTYSGAASAGGGRALQRLDGELPWERGDYQTDLLDPDIWDVESFQHRRDLFNIVDGDDAVERDLATAAARGTAIVAAEHC